MVYDPTNQSFQGGRPILRRLLPHCSRNPGGSWPVGTRYNGEERRHVGCENVHPHTSSSKADGLKCAQRWGVPLGSVTQTLSEILSCYTMVRLWA